MLEQLRSEPCIPLWQEKAGSRLAYEGSPSLTWIHVPNGAHLGQFAEKEWKFFLTLASPTNCMGETSL